MNFVTTAILQADYVQPLWGGRLDVGYKSTFRSFDNDYVYEIQDQNSGSFVNQPTISNRFLYQDQVHAGYLLYNYNFNKFNVSAGTRVEQTMVSSKLYNTGEERNQSYLDFFPSLQALYNMDDRHALKFTYSRRIDRPSAWRLNPFPDFSDSLNVRLGNPDLDPEYIQSFEVGHLINFDRANITYNFFYRHVNGQLDWIVRLEDGISYRQPSNLLSSTTYGLEFINMTEIFPWWNVNASFSIFQSEVDGSNIDSNFTNKGVSWSTKFTSDFDLFYGIDFQLVGNYTAPEVEAQGRDLARYYIDMSLQRSFLDDIIERQPFPPGRIQHFNLCRGKQD